MRLTLTETKYLKDSISIISDLITEARFKVSPQSMKVVAMDPANVAMVVLELFSSGFTEYDVKTASEFSINLNSFKQILKRTSASDTLVLELKENMLQVQLKGASTRTFKMSILEADDREQKIPTLNFAVTVVAPCTLLTDVVEDAAVIMADSVSFIADDKKMTFLAESDLNSVKIELKENEDIKITSTANVKAKYSIEYLKKMVHGSKLSDMVKIHLNSDYPLKLEYTVVDRVQLIFILAPRVEND